MNRVVLQVFLLLAFIPLAILFVLGIVVVAPILCSFLAINSYKFNNYKEMYIWMSVGGLFFSVFIVLSLYIIGIL